MSGDPDLSQRHCELSALYAASPHCELAQGAHTHHKAGSRCRMIRPAELTVAAQLAAFAAADIIVMAHGAAMSNFMFAKQVLTGS